MEKNEYIKTLNVAGKEVKLGLNDYGQCYFIEWVDEDGKEQSMGLGTYNSHYLEDIYYLFDPEYKALKKKELWGDYMTPKEYDRWLEYGKLFKKEYELS